MKNMLRFFFPFSALKTLNRSYTSTDSAQVALLGNFDLIKKK